MKLPSLAGTTMSTSPTPPPRHRRSLLRVWFPLVVLGLAVLALALLWGWPSEDWERVHRVLGTWAVALLVLPLLLLWWLAFSGVRWWLRLGTLLPAVAVLAMVRDV